MLVSVMTYTVPASTSMFSKNKVAVICPEGSFGWVPPKIKTLGPGFLPSIL